MSETKLMRAIQVLTGKIGVRLFRNNCGQYKNEYGHVIRFGIANPGGSDLIGWKPLKITHGMVGRTIAQFCAVEVKYKQGRLAEPQAAFIDIVNQCGGCGVVARSIEDAEKALTATVI